MANIEARELKDGTMAYRLTVELGYNPDGSRIRKRKTVNARDFGKKELGKRELNAELDKFKNEVNNDGYRDIEKMSFSAFVEQWKKRFLVNKEAKTEQNYSHIVDKRISPYFGATSMEKLTSFHVMDFLEKLSDDGLSDNSRVKYYRVLKSIFYWAKEWKVIKENPMDGVPKPKETDYDADVYNEEEVAQLFEALQIEKPMFRVLILLAVTAGLRRGELLGLEWKHINLDTGIIDVRQSIPMYKDQQPVIKEPKTKNSIRKVSIPAFVVAELDKYYLQARKDRLQVGDKWQGGDHFFLFANKYGLPYYPKTLSDMWRDFIKKNPGIKYIRFHDLRHTSATLLINKGVHAKTISSRLGHSNIKTTMNIYGHAMQSADRAAADAFNALFETKKDQQQKA
nr:site-specific integrase [Aneurinibacillus sp. XH2]